MKNQNENKPGRKSPQSSPSKRSSEGRDRKSPQSPSKQGQSRKPSYGSGAPGDSSESSE